MGKKRIVFFIVSLLIFGATASQAGQYFFSPLINDLSDLEHQWAYTWGINWNLPGGEQITSASLTFRNIYDWRVEEDRLYIHLLNTVADSNGSSSLPNWSNKTGYQSITLTYYDNQGGGDYFSGQGLLLENWNDPLGGSARNFNLVVPIAVDTLTDYLANGNFGFGMDPDCHYYNDKVKLTINTSTTSVPEPGTLLFLGSGLLGLVGWRGKRFIK